MNLRQQANNGETANQVEGARNAMSDIDYPQALELARQHVKSLSPPDPDYCWYLLPAQEWPDGWYFDYGIECLLDLPVKEWEAFFGAPGFVISKVGGTLTVLSHPQMMERIRRNREGGRQ